MALSRRLPSGQTHSTTRRTSRRERLLIPKDAVNAILLYALGRAQERNAAIKIHAYTTAKTHDHGCFTDATAPEEPSKLPSFMAMKNGLSARAINAHYGRGEVMWRPGSYGNCEIHDQAALEAQLLYVWTNNVKDGQVRRPEDWPGPTFLPEDFGEEFEIERPTSAFFGGRRPAGFKPTDPDALDELLLALAREEREVLQEARDRDKARGRSSKQQRHLQETRRRRRAKARERERLRPKRNRSTLPAKVKIRIDAPPGYEGWSLAAVKAHFRRLLDAELERIHAERLAEGKLSFVGAEAILRENPRKAADDTFPRFALNPRVACKDKERRRKVLRGLVAWRKKVAEKLKDWRKGHRDVVFPHGVYGMRRFHGALVAGADPPS